MGKYVCTLLKNAMNISRLQIQSSVDAVLLMGGNIRGNADYPEGSFFSMEALEAEVKSDEVVGVVPMPGWLLSAGVQAGVTAGVTAGGGEVQPMLVSASSSNSSLIGQVTVDYSPINTTGTLKFTSLADQHGVSTITVTVEDGGLDNDLATTDDNAVTTRTFEVTVEEVDPWHNRRLPEDVNNDGQVSPVDALLVVNHLNVHGAHLLPENRSSDSYWLDVNNDKWVSPSDALRVINFLNVNRYYAAIGVVPQDGGGNTIKSASVGEIFYLVFFHILHRLSVVKHC